jgi:hypothetical protein
MSTLPAHEKEHVSIPLIAYGFCQGIQHQQENFMPQEK